MDAVHGILPMTGKKRRRPLEWRSNEEEKLPQATSSCLFGNDDTNEGCCQLGLENVLQVSIESSLPMTKSTIRGNSSFLSSLSLSKGGRMPLVGQQDSSFFTFRIEHRKSTVAGAENPTEERLLLFRSDQPGCIGKIVFSYYFERCQRELDRISASIHVLSVHEAYRGSDFGGLLFSEALACMKRQFYGLNIIQCSLIAKEDVTRQGKLVQFYQQFGATIKDGVKGSLVNNNDGETYERIPMEIAMKSCANKSAHPSLSDSILRASFLPVSFYARESLNGNNVALTCKGEFRNWLIVEDKDGILYIQSTRQSMYHCQSDDVGHFRLLPRKTDFSGESEVVVWSVVSTTEELFLDADLCTFDLYFSRSPTFWEICDDDTFCLVKSVESPVWRSYYKRLWSLQTVSFVESMQQEFLSFNKSTMSILEALMLAKEYPADPFSGTGPSVRTLSFAAAEHARNAGQPDWIQFVALTQGLACAVKSTTTQEGAFDWTILDVECRVVGCKATSCGAFSEYRQLNPDENDDRYNTYLGMYKGGEGLEHVLLSWTSNEYMYHMMKHNKVSLPEEGYKILKLSPLVDWHSRGKYRELSTTDDEKVKQSVANFHDLHHRTKLSRLKDGEDLSDESCLSMWHSHYAMIVRKYTGTIKNMAW